LTACRKKKAHNVRDESSFLEYYIADGSSWSDDKVMKAENGEVAKENVIQKRELCVSYRNGHHIFLKEFSKLFKKKHSC